MHPAPKTNVLEARKSTGAVSAAPLTPKLVAQIEVPQPGGTVSYLGKDIPVLVTLKNQKEFYQEFTFWISILAIVVSIANYLLTRSNNSKARRQSINDEFWLRKVLYPLSIEPALEFYSEILSDLPKDRYDSMALTADVELFQTKFSEGHRALVAKTFSLKVASATLFTAIAKEFEEIEDLISEYCAANLGGFDQAATGSDHRQAQTESLLGGHLSSILGAIKAHQVEMK
jgi:hypothetical protein